jgi:alpha-galactosidase
MKAAILTLAFATLAIALSTPAVAEESMSKYILTPKPSPKPRINGAQVFGVRPGSPFLFKVPATGRPPLRYSAEKLPEGLSIDSATGVITGKVDQPGTHVVDIVVSNSLGTARRPFRIVVGEEICLTPPMGWNSWYAYSEGVSAEHIKKVADAFVKSGLRDHGWNYINIDDCWQGERDPETKVLMGNERFPDMRELCDYVHDLGLKIGTYSSPWIGTYAGFRGATSDNPDAADPECLPEDKRFQKHQIFGRQGEDGMGVSHYKASRIGKYWFFDKDAKAMADWGFDYIKFDWKPNDVPTTERMAKDLRASGRDIVLSLSNAAPIENAPALSKVANLWRTGPDIHDSWESISRCFNELEWVKFQRPGHWNDMDMLQVGMRGRPNRFNASPKKTKLTPDEQYTQMSMWCLQSNPLLLSCYIDQLDDFTMSLLTNDEVIEVNQDPAGKQVQRVHKDGDLEVWMKPMEDGSQAVGLFNRGDKTEEIKIAWENLGITGKQKVRDLWRQKDLGVYEDSFSSSVKSHGVLFVNVIKDTSGDQQSARFFENPNPAESLFHLKYL